MSAVCARGWGRTKRREALLRCRSHPASCWHGTETVGCRREGSVRAGAGPQLPAFGEAARLSVPQFPLAEMCWVQQDVPQVLACQRWPQRARLCWGCCPLGMLQRCWPGGWSLWGKERTPIPHESLVPQYLNRQVPQVGVVYPQQP